MELERKYVTLSKQKGHAVSQVTLEEDLNVPDQKPDIFRIVHRQGEFCLDEIKGEAGKVKVRGIFHYRILYIGEGAGHMPDDCWIVICTCRILWFLPTRSGRGRVFK